MWLEEALPAFDELLELERLEGTAAAQERLETFRQAYLGLRESGAELAALEMPDASASPTADGRPLTAEGEAGAVGRRRSVVFPPSLASGARRLASASAASKGVWVLWMLRRGLGELAFEELRREPGVLAITDRLREAIRRRVGSDFESFFDFWVYGTELPAYRLESATGRPLSRATGGYTVTLRLANDGTGAFPAPAVVRTEEGARHEFQVSVPGGEARDVTYPVLTRPVAAAVDPEGELLQSGPRVAGEWRPVRLRRWWSPFGAFGGRTPG
jgi:hypothetical protein